MIPGSANSLLLASAAGAAGGGYQIERSLRFNSADSAYLSRTPASAGNRKTWTWAGWVKRCSLATRPVLFSNIDASNNNGFVLNFLATGELQAYEFGGSTPFNVYTTSVYRDPSAWYHVVFVLDTTDAVAFSRTRMYVNGVQSTLTTAVSPSLNYDGFCNNTQLHAIGRQGNYSANYLNGYLADIHFIDGQALTPGSFGELDGNGIWQPKAYSGSYGTNGFHLPFSDNSTAAALGTDASPQGNTWAVNNISVAAGANNDSLVDSPTNYGTNTGIGGEIRGNYCTWNPLRLAGSSTLSDGNLNSNNLTSLANEGNIATENSGKWYWEVSLSGTVTGIPGIGFKLVSSDNKDYPGYVAASWGYYGDALKRNNIVGGSSAIAYGAAYSSGDIIGVALDLGAGSVVFYKNGVSQGTAFTGITGSPCVPYAGPLSTGSNITFVLNTGQRPFAYPVSGFKALCTANLLSTTIITSGSYTGNGVADGPFVYLNGVPTAMTVNGNAVTFGIDADKLSNGFRIRTTSTTFNQSASTYNYSITSTGDPFKTARAQAN